MCAWRQNRKDVTILRWVRVKLKRRDSDGLLYRKEWKKVLVAQCSPHTNLHIINQNQLQKWEEYESQTGHNWTDVEIYYTLL